GDIATLTVTCKGYESDSDEAAEVIADAVVMSVDEDEDVPVFYNGVNADDWGLTADDDHKALEVTIEETVVDAWDTVKAWKLVLPEGVYAVEGTTVTGNGTFKSWKADTDKVSGPVNAFEEAYKDGNYKEFDFGRRAMVVNEKDKAKITLNLVLVAEPSFTGDVVLTLEGDALETQEVTIAKFVAPYTVEAAQNDLVIDYKETVVPTPVVITEAEAGLWADEEAANGGATFALAVEKIEVEDADITVNEESEMEIDVDGESFVVEEESEDEAAVVTMDNVALYMQRAIPAGAYDLKLYTSMYNWFLAQPVFAQDAKEGIDVIGDVLDAAYDLVGANKEVVWSDNVTVKEGFVNVITAGRDKDDASFTKTVVVPVGAMEIVAGEEVVALDVPAYINAAGYTMLPVRAVAVALGIHTNNVIWDQATKTVTILYGQRIITMQVGSKVINVNGSAIPASAAVEIVNGRTFLGLRDLATALGVTDIAWDAATQTATLNGNK
ncbi:MAG: copper amine oxidase N-terminal domain-containing protein, partial [Anaerotignum sp.]|nr:copper amine oxidase N-terminal domain-containing protein [Anaerotignum sp.]